MTGIIIVGALAVAALGAIIAVAIQKSHKGVVSHSVTEEDLVRRVKLELTGSEARMLAERLILTADAAWKEKRDHSVDQFDEVNDRFLRIIVSSEKPPKEEESDA